MHDQNTKNQTKVQKETNSRMMHTITMNIHYNQYSVHKLDGISTDTFPGRQTTRPKQKRKSITTVTTQRSKRHGDPIRTQHLFPIKIKMIRIKWSKSKRRRYGHNSEIANVQCDPMESKYKSIIKGATHNLSGKLVNIGILSSSGPFPKYGSKFCPWNKIKFNWMYSLGGMTKHRVLQRQHNYQFPPPLDLTESIFLFLGFPYPLLSNSTPFLQC